MNQSPNLLAQRLVCPITHELPFDPVTAEDGRVSERSAIQNHFNHASLPARSPITNQPMGQLLFPSPQIKELIETMIESGAVVGVLKDAWQAKVRESQALELLKKAQGGAAAAMYGLSMAYFAGTNGFEKNDQQSFHWISKSHDLLYPPASAVLGIALMRGFHGGHEIRMHHISGLILVSVAAGQGSDVAALHLSSAYATGACGVPRNRADAIKWLTKGLSGDCAYRFASEEFREECRQKLEPEALEALEAFQS